MKTLIFCLLLCVAALLVPESKATCRLRNRAVYNNHVVVNRVIARRRIVHHNDTQTIVIVPQVILQDVQRDHYYSVGDAQLQELYIQAAMARLLIRGGAPQMPPAYDGPTQRKLAPKVNVVGSYQEAKLVALVKESCVKCHSVGSPNSVLMVDSKLAEISEGLAWKAFGLVNSGEMPKASEALKDDKVTLFYDWAKAQKGKK